LPSVGVAGATPSPRVTIRRFLCVAAPPSAHTGHHGHAAHRDAAFRAARHAIDETKARAPIWKAERFRDGHVWIGAPARTGPIDD